MVLYIRYMGQYRRPKHLECVHKVVVEELKDVELMDEFSGDDKYSYHPIMLTVEFDSGAKSVEYDICDLEIL